MTLHKTTGERADISALSDLCTPWCIHVVATLRIAELIAAGNTDIKTLAAAAGCNADVLQMVLRHLIDKGVFQEPQSGQFVLNKAAQGLLDPARRLGLDLHGIGGRMAYVWGSLLTAVQTGKPAYSQLFGLPFWEDLDAHPEIAASFDALMGPLGHGIPDPEILPSGDWENIRTVVDVGGGTGTLLAEILRSRPQLHGTLIDLPRTIARSGETFQAAGVAERVRTIGQSFFDPLPVGADLYVLKSVFNDWPDREGVAILSRCAEAARPGGRVVILGGVLPDSARDALSVTTVLLGGRDRTLTEFRELAREAGLAVQAAGRLPSGRFAVECRPICQISRSERREKRKEEKHMSFLRRSSSPNVKRLHQRRDMEGLMAALVDPADEIRKSAARALGEIKDTRAIDPLIAALQDPVDSVRASAAGALGTIGDACAVDPLIAVLTDPANDVRQSAARALGEIKDARAADPLLTLYFKERDIAVVVAVLKALGQIGGDRAVEVLITTLEDQSTTEEQERALYKAANALRQIGDARAVEPLRAVQQNRAHQGFVREAAASALKQIKSSR